MQQSDQQKKKRDNILKSAEKIFSLSGFHKADMSEIAKSANVAKGTVYLYFPSKKELFISVIKDGLEDLSQKINNEVKNIDDAVEKIKKAISTHMLFFKSHQELYRILIHPDVELMEDIFTTLKDIKLSKLPKLIEGLENGINAGQIRKLNAKSLSYMILGMTDLLLFQWLSNPEEESLESKIEQLFDVLFNGILNGK